MKKKVFLLFFVFIFLTTLVFSATITVTNPHSGQVWYKGKTYTITWVKSGSMKEIVKLRLFKKDDQGFKLRITDSTENDGSFEWTVPATVADGSYYIRVKTIDNAVYDDGDLFEIKDKKFDNNSGINGSTNNIGLRRPHYSVLMKISIISPSKSSEWKEGNTMKISWDDKYTKGKKVNIELYDYTGKRLIKTIQKNWRLGNAFKWTIPKLEDTSTLNRQFRIKITTSDKSAEGMSDNFHISRNIVKKTIIIPYDDIQPKWKGFRQFNILCNPSRSDYVSWKGIKGTAIVGYENSYREWGVSCFFKQHESLRSYIHFNLNQLPKNIMIISAVLNLEVVKDVYLAPGEVAHRPTETSLGRIVALTSPLTNAFSLNGNDIYTTDYDNLKIIKVPITKTVINWRKGKNYGLVLISRDEAFHKTKEINIFYFKPSLKVVYFESE